MTPQRLLTAALGLLFAAALHSPSLVARTGPGDTIVVQTFTWDWPVLPGWNAPREGRFLFPDASKRYEKILMYYTLKCDPRQNPACGEWDYLTYTHLHHHTGRLDSNRMLQPSFLVNNVARDTLLAMTAPTRLVEPRMEERSAGIDPATRKETALGTAAGPVTVLTADPGGSRAVLLWRASELTAAGVQAGALAGLRVRVRGVGPLLTALTIRLKAHQGSFDAAAVANAGGWTRVHHLTVQAPDDGWLELPFSQSWMWNGTDDILVDLSASGVSTPLVLDAAASAETAAFLQTGRDGALHFAQRMEVNAGPIPELNAAAAVTLEAWIRPDAFVDWAEVASKYLSNENRFGIQLGPRNDGNVDVYCLTGNGSNHYGNTTTRPIAAGRWRHLAMVFNGAGTGNTERLRLYIDGVEQTLSYNGTIQPATAVNGSAFTISSSRANSFQGAIDEVRLWSRALSGEEVRARMHARITPADPLFGQLIAAWNFDETVGRSTPDVRGQYPGTLALPHRVAHGPARFKAFEPGSERPVTGLLQGMLLGAPAPVLAFDTVAVAPLMVTLFDHPHRANIPTDTLARWPLALTRSFDAAGRVVDSSWSAPDEVRIREDRPYYSAPFEVVDRYELGRFITPYGIGLSLGEGWTWVYDVTDFREFLVDSVRLTAGNWQELLDMKFVMIEGTPPRDVRSIRNLWKGTFPLSAMAQRMAPMTLDLDPGASMFKLRTTLTGHQFDNPTNCAEFCPKMHSVWIDGVQRYSWQIIQECADNPLHPQGGTWIYDRAGWCPGAPATTQELELTPYITGRTVTLDYESQYDQYGEYVVETQLVSYGPPNFRNDAAVAAILQPSTYELNKRFNPICGRPQIVLKNTGAEPLTSVEIEYGPAGAPPATYRWTGNLPFLATENVFLPALPWTLWQTDSTFRVRVSSPNGAADEYAYNNTLTSRYQTVPVYTAQPYIYFRTNNAGFENYYQVLDANGAVVHQRSGLPNAQLVRDTLRLAPGCYEFILHDSGNDGISFWANNDGTGNLSIRFVGGGSFRSFIGDFGKDTRHQFVIAGPSSVEDVPVPTAGLTLYPNPTAGRLTVSFDVTAPAELHFEVFDAMGRRVRSTERRAYAPGTHEAEFEAASLDSGVYLVRMLHGDHVLRTSSVRIVR